MATDFDAQTEQQTDRRRAVFTQSIVPHRDDLCRLARRLCRGDNDRAQDFVQDALVRAYRACLSGRFQEDSNPRAWLLRILTNLYINDYHHRRRWEAAADLDAPQAVKALTAAARRAALAETPDALLLAATLDESVEQALASLPDKLRHCLILVDMEGLDYAQAALALGVPIGTVRSRLSRAHFKLSGLLDGYARSRRLLA